MTYPVNDFLDFLSVIRRMAPTKYMWGTFGNLITDKLITAKQKQYPTRYTGSRVKLLKSYIGKATYGCDCCGLIKWFLMTDGGERTTPKYNSTYDLTASGYYEAAKRKGKISTLPETPGLAVYKKGHIGVYIGNGKVCECTLGVRGDGVVISDLSACAWTDWLEIPWITYTAKTTVQTPKPVIAAAVKPRGLKLILNKLGQIITIAKK